MWLAATARVRRWAGGTEWRRQGEEEPLRQWGYETDEESKSQKRKSNRKHHRRLRERGGNKKTDGRSSQSKPIPRHRDHQCFYGNKPHQRAGLIASYLVGGCSQSRAWWVKGHRLPTDSSEWWLCYSAADREHASVWVSSRRWMHMTDWPMSPEPEDCFGTDRNASVASHRELVSSTKSRHSMSGQLCCFVYLFSDQK